MGQISKIDRKKPERLEAEQENTKARTPKVY